MKRSTYSRYSFSRATIAFFTEANVVAQQVFVANPKKSKPVQDILLKNRDKLLAFLPKFHDDRRGEIPTG